MKKHCFLLSPSLFIICGFLLLGCGSKKSTESENQLGSIDGTVMVFVNRTDANDELIGIDTLANPTGIAIRLLNESKTSVVETTRCVSGVYQFNEVKAGTYVVSAQVCNDIKMNGEWSQPFQVTPGKTVQVPTCFFGPYAEEESTDVFESWLPYPNPFDPSYGYVTIIYLTSGGNSGSLVYFYPSGDTVNVFSLQNKPAGPNHLYWDGKDTFGVRVPLGIYFIKLEVSLITTPYSKFVTVQNVVVAGP